MQIIPVTGNVIVEWVGHSTQAISNKVWAGCATDQGEYVAVYGKRGGSLQVDRQQFTRGVKAAAQLQKKVAEKLGKGYRAVKFNDPRIGVASFAPAVPPAQPTARTPEGAVVLDAPQAAAPRVLPPTPRPLPAPPRPLPAPPRHQVQVLPTPHLDSVQLEGLALSQLVAPYLVAVDGTTHTVVLAQDGSAFDWVGEQQFMVAQSGQCQCGMAECGHVAAYQAARQVVVSCALIVPAGPRPYCGLLYNAASGCPGNH